MGVSLGQLAANTASVDVQYGNLTIHVEYLPANVTENALLVMSQFQGQDAAAMRASFQTFNEMLASLIHDWDLYEDEAQTEKVPINAARFQGLPPYQGRGQIPIALRAAVLGAILGDIRPEALTAPVTTNS